MSTVIDNFCAYYQELTLEKLTNLDNLYTEEIVFEDPIHKTEGLDDLVSYFKATMSNTTYCRFNIDKVVETEGIAFITWSMVFTHPRLNNHNEIRVPGVSEIKFDEKIFYQRDYYDVGAMLYEHIPLLKNVIAQIKKRLSS